MTTWMSLLHCAEADVTLQRIRGLIEVTGTEPLTVDFKEGGDTPKVAECAAAMANTHGGLIFIGITDKDREIVGVSREAIAHVADVFATRLEFPDWRPETFEVPLGDENPDRYVLVIRIDRLTAPRPVFVKEKNGRIFWAPVRMPGSTRQATRDELYALFTESRPADALDDQWAVHAPDIPDRKDGSQDVTVDLVMRSALRVPVGPTAWGRPLSERAVARLASRLDHSALPVTLFRLTARSDANIESFHQEGQDNRSGMARLVWRHEPVEPIPFEIEVRVEVPGHYGYPHVDAFVLTLTLTSRLTSWLNASRPDQSSLPGMRRLDITEWAALLNAVPATLTSPDVVNSAADLAGVDPITIRQLKSLHIVSRPPMAALLPAQLRSIPDAGVSHGAHMLADPALDLSNPPERDEQVDRWLRQIATDAGLLGMEQLVVTMRASERLSHSGPR